MELVNSSAVYRLNRMFSRDRSSKAVFLKHCETAAR